jgi:hypothetical protein
VKSTRKRTIGFMSGKDTAMGRRWAPRDRRPVAIAPEYGYRYSEANTATRQNN